VNSETDDFALSGVVLMVARCVVTTRVVVIIKSTRFMACNMKTSLVNQPLREPVSPGELRKVWLARGMKTWRREHRCTKTKKRKKKVPKRDRCHLSTLVDTFER
jgi:hypothetical protein